MSTGKDEENKNNTFVDGLCVMLQGMNTRMSQHVVNLTMGHLITMLDDTRFENSHAFVNLFVSQLDVTMDGLPVDARIPRT